MHQFSGLGVEAILKNSLMRQSLDNVTVVMVAFENFKKTLCSGDGSVTNEVPPDAITKSENNGKEQKAEKENVVNRQLL